MYFGFRVQKYHGACGATIVINGYSAPRTSPSIVKFHSCPVRPAPTLGDIPDISRPPQVSIPRGSQSAHIGIPSCRSLIPARACLPHHAGVRLPRLSQGSVLHATPQVYRTISTNSQCINTFQQSARFTCERPTAAILCLGPAAKKWDAYMYGRRKNGKG